MRNPRGTLLLAALLVPGRLAAQDSVRLRLQPPPNTTVAYHTVSEMWMSGPGIREDTNPTMRISGYWSLVLVATRRDTFDFQITRDSLRVVSLMGSLTPSGEVQVDTVPFSPRGAAILSVARIRRDSARVAGLASNPMAALGAIGGQPGFFSFPERALAIGATWGDTTISRIDSTPDGKRYTVRMQLSHRLEGFVQDGARRVAVISSASWMEMTVDQLLTAFNGTGRIEVDMATGMILRSSESSEGSMDMGGTSMPIRTRTSLERLR